MYDSFSYTKNTIFCAELLTWKKQRMSGVCYCFKYSLLPHFPLRPRSASTQKVEKFKSSGNVFDWTLLGNQFNYSDCKNDLQSSSSLSSTSSFEMEGKCVFRFEIWKWLKQSENGTPSGAPLSAIQTNCCCCCWCWLVPPIGNPHGKASCREARRKLKSVLERIFLSVLWLRPKSAKRVPCWFRWNHRFSNCSI